MVDPFQVGGGLGSALRIGLFGPDRPQVLFHLTDAPWAIATLVGSVWLSVPLAALRWGILLRALGVPIPSSICFISSLSACSRTCSCWEPPVGTRSARIYAWRALGRSGGAGGGVGTRRSPVHVLFGALFFALVFTLFYWRRMQLEPALAALGTSDLVAVAACIIGRMRAFRRSRYDTSLEQALLRWPRAAQLVVQVRRAHSDVAHQSVMAVVAAFALAWRHKFSPWPPCL